MPSKEQIMIGPYLVDNVVLKQYTGEDEFGTPTARTSVTVKSNVDYKNRQVTSLAGETIVSMAKVLMRNRTITRSGFDTRATSTIAYEDTINFDGVDHAIIRIARKKDFSVRYMEVYVA